MIFFDTSSVRYTTGDITDMLNTGEKHMLRSRRLANVGEIARVSVTSWHTGSGLLFITHPPVSPHSY